MTDNESESTPSLEEILEALTGPPNPWVDRINEIETLDDYFNLPTEGKCFLWQHFSDQMSDQHRDAAIVAHLDPDVAVKFYSTLWERKFGGKTDVGVRSSQDAYRAQIANTCGMIAVNYLKKVKENGPERLDALIESLAVESLIAARYLRLARLCELGEATKEEFWDDLWVGLAGGWPDEDWDRAQRLVLKSLGDVIEAWLNHPEEYNQDDPHACPDCGGEVQHVIVSDQVFRA